MIKELDNQLNFFKQSNLFYFDHDFLIYFSGPKTIFFWAPAFKWVIIIFSY